MSLIPAVSHTNGHTSTANSSPLYPYIDRPNAHRSPSSFHMARQKKAAKPHTQLSAFHQLLVMPTLAPTTSLNAPANRPHSPPRITAGNVAAANQENARIVRLQPEF